MIINIFKSIEGAKEATGVTVIIDVFRAFSVEAYAASKNAYRIIPVGDQNIAYKYKEDHPDSLLIGERHGVKLPGFDFGNSPAEFINEDFSGKVIVHTTSAGTQGIANANKASMILTGSLVNAKAIATYLKQNDFPEVSLVCMGLEGIYETEEDNLCAYYIKECIEHGEPDIKDAIQDLKNTSGAKFFDPALQTVFPEPDFDLCTDLNKFNFVLKLVKNPDGLDYVERIDINSED